MIAHLRGVLTEKQPDQVIIEVGGVGYRVFVPSSTLAELPALGVEVKLLTVTYVREDLFQLYGFATREEKELFQLLTLVTGVGVKLALAALSALTPGELVTAIAGEDLTKLSRISGVGRRIAQRMVLELKERITTLGIVAAPVSAAASRPAAVGMGSLRNEVTSALLNLGFKRPQIDTAVQQAITPEITTVEVAIKAALKLLMPGGG